jgi:sterol 3beta-glucosyltransferase
VPTPLDWPPDAVATGYWLREHHGSAEPLGPRLESFVAEGVPPVYIGFGSSVGPDPADLGATVARAVRDAGVRAVIATGWGGVSNLHSDSRAVVIDQAPHRRLFPRVSAVVHHGGAGTTAAGLVAARPTVVCPFQGDQHLWGAAVHRAGAGPKPLPARKLTPEHLAAAIRAAIQDAGMRHRAGELAQRIAKEDGTGTASEQIEAVLRS